MKLFRILSAACAFTFISTAYGASIDVTFNASLTNETEWVYTEKTKTTVDGKLYISSKDGVAVMSPVFDFAITSVTVVAYHSSEKPARKLFAAPISDDNTLKREITPQNGKNQDAVSCSWNKSDRIQSIGFKMEEGLSGNIYLLSAKILGISIPYPPENLEAARVGGRQITVKWRKTGNAVKYKVGVYKSTWSEKSFETVCSYDFNEFSNDGGSNKKVDAFTGNYSDFAGSALIYLPADTVGQIQISKSDEKGVLKHKGFENCDSLHVDMTLRKYFYAKTTEEDGNTVIKEYEDNDIMTIGYEDPLGTTNIFTTVNLEKDFKREIIPLKNFPAGTPILFNATGDKGSHRVIIDEIKFIENYSPAGERLVLVQEINTADSKIRLLNLERNTDYVIMVTAIDANGKESEDAELRVKTSSQNDSGFFIRIQ